MNEKIVRILLKKGKVANNNLVLMTGIPKAQVSRDLKAMSEWLMPVSQFVEIKPECIEELSKMMGETNWKKLTKKIVGKIAKYKKDRPAEDRKLDQFTATNWTTARRAVLMAKNGDIKYKNVAIIGDDDMNSLAIAIIGGANKITVFEIDQRLVDFAKKVALENSFPIEVLNYDVRNELSAEYLGKFDTVLMDPPYTTEGMSEFINRGIEILKPGMDSRMYVAYGNSDRAREKEVEVQKMILNKGLLIKEKKYQFCRYFGSVSIGSRSSLYLLDWTPKTRLTKFINNKFYTYE